MKRTLMLTMTAFALAAPVAGQDVTVIQPAQATVTFEKEMAEKQTVERARMAVESRITPGAPYSADVVTESVQVLSDGNRIARKTATRVYRDSEGRTRREQLSSTGEVQSVSISDPVAGTMYVLNPADRTAQRNGVFVTSPTGFATAGVMARGRGTVTAAGTAEAGVLVTALDKTDEDAHKREVEAQAARAGGGRGRGEGSAGTAVYPAEGVSLPRTVAPGGFVGGGIVNKEELGQQVVDGVLATGSRMTTTIPAGTIGNEQPLQIVSEQWFSPDLKVLVMTKHSDPRTGDTTYRMSNIVQAEPARSLFEVPADYTLKTSVIRQKSPMQPHD